MLFVSRLDVRDHGGLVNFQELLQALTESAHDYVPLPVGTAVTKALHTRRMKAPIKRTRDIMASVARELEGCCERGAYSN